MRKKMEWQWESLDANTRRAKVIGGWLVHCFRDFLGGKKDLTMSSESMQFVSDRDHEWHIVPAAKEAEAAKPTVKAADFEPK